MKIRARFIPLTLLICCPSMSQSHAAVHQVTVSGLSFSPQTITINAGDTVTWTGLSFFHSTTSGTNCEPDDKWNSGRSVSTFSRTFNDPGSYPYYCIPHCNSGMTGTVIVNAASDTIAPDVTAFDIPTTSTSLTVAITTFTATDAKGVTGYMVTETSTKPSASAASGWSATAPTSYTFGSEGSKTLFAWAKDAAGNVSASKSANLTIILSHKGDINNDGLVNLQDAFLALRLFTGLSPAGDHSAYLTSGADVEGNNKMGLAEVIYILQRVGGIR